MLKCRDITRLISLSMDTRLPWSQRLAVRLHLSYCQWCARYARQLRLLALAASRYELELTQTFQDRLPEPARNRIAERLRQESLPPALPPAPSEGE